MNAMYQSVATRTAGTNSIDLYTMEAAMHILISVMMYLSGIPVVLSIRSSTEEAWDVQDRRKLSGLSELDASKRTRVLRRQMKSILQLDLLFVAVVWILVAAIEQSQVSSVGLRPKQFSAYLPDTCV